MKQIGILFCIISLCFACGSDLETVENKDDAGNVIEKFTRKKVDFAKEGLSTSYTSTGVKIEEANYKNDTLHGKRVIFDENEKPQTIEHYDMGEFVGIFQTLYPNGQTKLEGQYTNGAMNGEWKKYYKNGQLMEVVKFENNEENGPFVEYHENGKLKTEGNYLEGDNEDGLLKIYDQNGELEKKMDCVKRICRTIWTKEQGDIVPEKITIEIE